MLILPTVALSARPGRLPDDFPSKRKTEEATSVAGLPPHLSYQAAGRSKAISEAGTWHRLTAPYSRNAF